MNGESGLRPLLVLLLHGLLSFVAEHRRILLLHDSLDVWHVKITKAVLVALSEVCLLGLVLHLSYFILELVQFLVSLG